MTITTRECREGAVAGTTIGRSFATIRPRDAATIILLDRQHGALRVLMGRRSSRHIFMPETYVFPGGRRDRGDHALPFRTDLHPAVIDKLMAGKARGGVVSARALALAAMRELSEETGLRMGGETGQAPPDLHCLRYVARAVTPPGLVRRFDTRFFCTFTEEAGINPALIRDTEELQDLRWVDISKESDLNIPSITRTVLDGVKALIDIDPALAFGHAVPYYFSRHGRFVQSSI